MYVLKLGPEIQNMLSFQDSWALHTVWFCPKDNLVILWQILVGLVGIPAVYYMITQSLSHAALIYASFVNASCT